MKPSHISVLLATVAAVAALSLAPASHSIAQGRGGGGGGGGDAEEGGGGGGVGPILPAGVKTTFVHLGNGEPAVLYEPINPGPKAQIGVITEHSALDELTTQTCTELSRRGYRVFCVNNSNDKSRDFNNGSLDRVTLETKKAVVWLKAYPGIKKVILWGHSGGSSVMTAYQSVAQSGVAFCQNPNMIWKCSDSLAKLPVADGVILGDANWGIAADVLNGADPSIELDSGLKIAHPDLDSYSPANGFDPKGSHYSAEFVKRVQRAQSIEINKLIDKALKMYADIKAGKGVYKDDDIFTIPGASFVTHGMYVHDLSLMHHTARAWPLVHPDGSITNEIIYSVRPATEPTNVTPDFRGALKTTVTGFLSSYAVRTDPDKYSYAPNGLMGLTGMDFRSTRASPVGNAEGITSPILILGMTGAPEMSVVETLYDHTKSTDKEAAFIEGAAHAYPTCKPCEKTPGQYGDTIKTLYDYADKWLSKPGRFLN